MNKINMFCKSEWAGTLMIMLRFLSKNHVSLATFFAKFHICDTSRLVVAFFQGANIVCSDSTTYQLERGMNLAFQEKND